ncbi:hypothetical protein VitviT2T_022836 [Vitis vinifera]|nr:hypothetical protein VitviT2T_022836 [Vitis vinifera]
MHSRQGAMASGIRPSRNKGHQDRQQQGLHLEEIPVQPRTKVRLQEKAFVYQVILVLANSA